MRLQIIISFILIDYVQIISSSWWYIGLKINNANSINNNNNNNTSSNKNTNIDKINFSGQNLFELSNKLRVRSYENNNNNAVATNSLRKYCSNTRIFESGIQRKICYRHEKLVDVIARAAKIAIDECQYQFKFRRWNCSVYERPTANVFGSLTHTTSRETAFIYAINSASAMYQVTKACTRGELRGCSCNRKLSYNPRQLGGEDKERYFKEEDNMGKYEWGGCSENVLFGHKLSKIFVDSKENSGDSATSERISDIEAKLINLHNNEVGRRIILKNMKQVCKCHGVSGSCSVKVCWKVMPDFREIGNKLTEKYQEASRLENESARMRIRRLKAIASSSGRHHRSTRQEIDVSLRDSLIYLDKSPNFCYPSRRFDTPGTSGRVCGLVDEHQLRRRFLSHITTNSTVFNCRYLCCGRGHRVRVIETEENCDCQFQWCCSVKCKKCKKKVIQYVCN